MIEIKGREKWSITSANLS